MSYIIASLPPIKFPDFQAAKDFYTVDGSRKWSAGDDWFYDIQERT